MADKIKISQLTQIENLSDDDEFVVIDKSILTGTCFYNSTNKSCNFWTTKRWRG